MTDAVIIAAPLVIASERDLRPGYVEIAAGRIVRAREGRPRRADLVVREGTLIPGLIDLQINGAAGVDFAACTDPQDLLRVGRHLLATGVTAYLATIISAPPNRLRATLAAWRRLAPAARAPRLLGIHLEGPYLSAAFAGAHRPADLHVGDVAEFTRLLDASGRLIRLVTLAPDVAGVEEVLRTAVRGKIIVAAGHTGATYEQATQAFARGVSMVTHLFNAMRPVHQRDPGIAVAALAAPHVTASLIADFVHVHPAMLKLAIEAKGPSRIALITDAVAATGTTASTSRLGGRTVSITDAPRLPGGRLAGSTLTLDQAVRNIVRLGVPLREAVLMATAVPAVALGRRDLGRIAPGARADLVVVDRALCVQATFVAGRQAYAGEPS